MKSDYSSTKRARTKAEDSPSDKRLRSRANLAPLSEGIMCCSQSDHSMDGLTTARTQLKMFLLLGEEVRSITFSNALKLKDIPKEQQIEKQYLGIILHPDEALPLMKRFDI